MASYWGVVPIFVVRSAVVSVLLPVYSHEMTGFAFEFGYFRFGIGCIYCNEGSFLDNFDGNCWI